MTAMTTAEYELRNIGYFKAQDGSGDDILFLNEKVHHPDGKIETRYRTIKNFKKPIFIHKEGYRKYKQKKVWQPRSQMDIYHTTEANLVDTIKRALNIPLGRYMTQKQVCRSPYVYGADISPTSIMKKAYKDKFPTTVSKSTVGVIDIETNVKSAKNEIIAITLSYGNKAIVATTKDFLGSTPLPEQNFFKKLDEITPEVRRDRKVDVEFHIAETSALAVIEVFKRAHEWKPDFITGWNSMGFDIPKIIEALEDEGYNPADILSDPSIEPRFRCCNYRKGPTSKKAQSGREMPLAGYEQWHWLEVPSPFYFLDSMCLFYHIRRGAEKEENYKLDTILTKYIGRGKVGIPEAEHLDGVDKHRFMQERYKLEYLVYNLFDCIGVEILDETLKDISSTLPVLTGISDFANFTSNPKRLADAMHFFVQDSKDFNGVLGTVSDEMKSKLDEECVGLNNWIVTLATERLQDMGQYFLKELPEHQTKVHAQSADTDVSSGYPNAERSMNMSRDTTVHEMSRIEGITYDEQQILGLNLMGGKANSLSFATKVYRLPQPKDAYNEYLKLKAA